MTFYYDEDADVLEGNRLGNVTEVDGETVTIDVEAIMKHGRGLGKLREMKREIQKAIDAHESE